jgi:hypothetical protein
MEADDQQIARFMEATHTSFEQAQFFLEAAGGNYDRGVSMFYGGWLSMPLPRSLCADEFNKTSGARGARIPSFLTHYAST